MKVLICLVLRSKVQGLENRMPFATLGGGFLEEGQSFAANSRFRHWISMPFYFSVEHSTRSGLAHFDFQITRGLRRRFVYGLLPGTSKF